MEAGNLYVRWWWMCEMDINKQKHVKVLIDKNIIDNKEKEKWLILKSRK